jgi:hypothetical protein
MTRTFYRLLTFGVLASGATIASADVIGIRAHLGYHWTQSFELRTGGNGTMSGPEVGIDFPITRLPGIQLYASPSVVFAGRGGLSSGTEGQIYRFSISARQRVSRDGLFATGSIGFAHSQASAAEEFRSANGFVASIGLGAPLKFKFAGVSPSLEGRYYFSSEDQFRGFTVGFSIDF